MAHKIKFSAVYLYVLLFVIVLLHGTGLIKKAYNYKEPDFGYTKKEIILRSDPLRLVFSNGYIAIHCWRLQLTEDSGLACFFDVKGVAYATFKAIWRIEKIGPDSLSAICEWPDLPIKQNWRFLLKEGKLEWQVYLESSENIAINHIGLVFSFKNNYREWTSSSKQGKMPVLEALEQRQNVVTPVGLNAVGLSVRGQDARFFPVLGLSLGKGTFLNEILLSTCRDMFTSVAFSSVSISGDESLKMLKNSKVLLSSGEIKLLNER